jgi:tRNA G18 (ribose-2'-O)-methylase SpoU
MLGVADSLNVSAAAAILLYEARRQRDAAPERLRATQPNAT